MKFDKKILFPFIVLLLWAIISCEKDKNSLNKPSRIFFTDCVENNIGSIDLTIESDLVCNRLKNSDSLKNPVGIALTEDGYVIVTDQENNKILKFRKNGSGEMVVLYDQNNGVNQPNGVAVDDNSNCIYWCNSGTNQIMKGSLDGYTGAITLYNGFSVISTAFGLAIDKKHGKLIVSDFFKYILSGNLDGTGTMQVLWDNTKYKNLVAPSKVFVDACHNKIYWSDESNDEIVEANLDGTGTPTVLFDANDGVCRPDGIAVDNFSGIIYWSETDDNVIVRGNLDGTGKREVIISGVESYGLAIDYK